MYASTSSVSQPILSICIPTFNRSSFIGDTLDSILKQMNDRCEVVVLDGGSTDETQEILAKYISRHKNVRYIRQETNSGFDRDCDRAVELARGEYCWLMADDDLLKPGAIDAVLEVLNPDVSAVFVNVEDKDFTMSRVLVPRRLELQSDKVFSSGEMDRLFMELGEAIMYVGAVVIKRSIWLERERQRYIGTAFIFVGVIFQSPLPGQAIVIATPLVSYRRGNHHAWTSSVIEILWERWPTLISQLPLSESIKNPIQQAKPWKDLHTLMLWRAMGSYSVTEYRRWVQPRSVGIKERIVPMLVTYIPGILANTAMLLYYSVTTKRYRRLWSPGTLLEDLKISRFYFRNWVSTFMSR